MRVFALLILAALVCDSAFPQASATAAFEIADVRTSPHSDNPSLRIFQRDGFYELLGATMVDLVSRAYDVKPSAVAGRPSWLESDRFDVIAKTPSGSTPEALRAMLKSLLADRFALVAHNDTQLLPAYLLTSGKHPRLQHSGGTGGDCRDQPAEHSPAINAAWGCRDITMTAFAEALQASTIGPVTGYISGRPVVDRTGFTGTWNFSFKWTGVGLLARAGSDGVTLLDALDKQLGLNLEMGQAPQQVLVVDSVNRKASANLPGVTEKIPEIRLEFDVADIKPSAQDKPTAPRFTPGGRMEVKGVTLIALIQHEWGLDTYDEELIAGGPKWLGTERFDIVATATPPAGPASALKDDDSLRAMLRNMLTDRFKLSLHNEEKPVTVFALLGEKQKLKRADDSERSKCTEGAAVATGTGGALQRAITCTNTTAAQLAERLHGLAAGYANRPVVDLTGGDDAWDFSVVYSPPGFLQAAITNGDGEAGAAAPNGAISLFEAMGKQLGLKVETQKRAMPVLVIDHVEQMPTDN